jgi:hypothetical protein
MEQIILIAKSDTDRRHWLRMIGMDIFSTTKQVSIIKELIVAPQTVGNRFEWPLELFAVTCCLGATND